MHLEHRRTLRAEWEDLTAEEFRLLCRAAKKVGKTLRDPVQVEVVVSGNREPLSDLLRNEIGGRLSEAIRALDAMETLSLPELADKCRESVRTRFGRRLASRNPKRCASQKRRQRS